MLTTNGFVNIIERMAHEQINKDRKVFQQRKNLLAPFTTAMLVLMAIIPSTTLVARGRGPLDIGSRLELFVDDYLLSEINNIDRIIHSPEPKEIALRFDTGEWEGSISGYITILKDGNKFKMYYRGEGLKGKPTDKGNHILGPEVTCYAESDDGMHWVKPKLNLFVGEFFIRDDIHPKGTKYTVPPDNNIVWIGQGDALIHTTHNFTPFIDRNPNCKPQEKFKAVGRMFPNAEQKASFDFDMSTEYSGGLIGFVSPDGIQWKPVSNDPIIADKGHVNDAQNIVFWDTERNCYVEYHRFIKEYRDFKTSTSKEFKKGWGKSKMVEYTPPLDEHFYSPTIIQYERAPHIYIGLPMRLTDITSKLHKSWNNHIHGQTISDVVMITSRNGEHFDRQFREAFLRAGIEHGKEEKNMHGNNTIAWGLVQTDPDHYSLYWNEDYYSRYNCGYLRRGTIRIDGFASMHAKFDEGSFTTKPIVFDGGKLCVNFSTSARGHILVEIQDKDGQPIPGFTQEDCDYVIGNKIEETVLWKGKSDVSKLAGTPIRLLFVMKDADLYSIQFRP